MTAYIGLHCFFIPARGITWETEDELKTLFSTSIHDIVQRERSVPLILKWIRFNAEWLEVWSRMGKPSNLDRFAATFDLESELNRFVHVYLFVAAATDPFVGWSDRVYTVLQLLENEVESFEVTTWHAWGPFYEDG